MAYARIALMALVGCVVPGVARAEIENIEAGGSIEIYGAWCSEFYEPAGAAVRIPRAGLRGRAIGPFGTMSEVRADGTGNEAAYVEQRTRLHLRGSLTGGVQAFVEVDSIESWGEDFRSTHLTGLDARAASGDDVELYQAYIEAENFLGTPLRLRIGRQELVYGTGWLLSNNPTVDPFTGLSFDAVLLEYDHETLSVDAWWSKLADTSPAEQDGDTDFYGVYISTSALSWTTIEAYWLFVRDATGLRDSIRALGPEWLEDVLGLDDYDVTTLHTLGLRFTGKVWGVDWDVEAAWQRGAADAVGAMFRLYGYGDDGANWNVWAGRADLGYTFDARWQPRLSLGAAYYSGEDRRGISFWNWLNPFTRARAQASVSFNRLFSGHQQDIFLDGTALSNFWLVRGGMEITPTDRVQIGADLLYKEVVEPFARPLGFRLVRWLTPIAPQYPFLQEKGAKDLGWQFSLYGTYAYSDDLSFEAGWTHYFVGEAIRDGAFVDSNGLGFIGGLGAADADYVYFMTTLAF